MMVYVVLSWHSDTAELYQVVVYKRWKDAIHEVQRLRVLGWEAAVWRRKVRGYESTRS